MIMKRSSNRGFFKNRKVAIHVHPGGKQVTMKGTSHWDNPKGSSRRPLYKSLGDIVGGAAGFTARNLGRGMKYLFNFGRHEEGYRSHGDGEVVHGSGEVVKDISEKVAKSEGLYAKIPRKKYLKLLELEPEKQEKELRRYLLRYGGKDVNVPIRELEEALHHVRHTSGYQPSLVESILERDIKYGSPESKKLVQDLACKLEHSKGEYLNLSRKDLKKAAKSNPLKQEKKLKEYLSKGLGEYVKVSREDILGTLEHLQGERGYHMSPLEKLAYRSTAVLSLVAAVWFFGAPAMTGFAVSSTAGLGSFRVLMALVFLLTSGYCFKKTI